MNNAKPFIKWAGGKTQLLPAIDSHLPDEFETYDTYIEPFIGSGAVMFHIASKYPNIKHIIINDYNIALYNLYMAVKLHHRALIDELSKLQGLYHSLQQDAKMELFYKLRDRFNKWLTSDYTTLSEGSKITFATYFIALNKTCFNGLYRVNSKGLFNTPWNKAKTPTICDEENLKACHEVLQKVDIMNGDYSIVKSTLDNPQYKKVFAYFDPPYKPISKTASFTAYTNNNFDDNEQLRLKAFCDEVGKKWKIMLSNSDPKNTDPDNNFFDELYSNYEINRVPAKRNINSKSSGRGEINEVLITNYKKNGGLF